MKILTLCIVRRNEEVLLGMKKLGFGAGRWNAFGGKPESGETIEEAARREVLEEAGITVGQIEERGVIQFEFRDGTELREVHVFVALDFEGDPRESDEMRPEWFDEDKIPFEMMWPADVYWLPILLAGKYFRGRALFDRPSTAERASVVLERSFKEVADLGDWAGNRPGFR